MDRQFSQLDVVHVTKNREQYIGGIEAYHIGMNIGLRYRNSSIYICTVLLLLMTSSASRQQRLWKRGKNSSEEEEEEEEERKKEEEEEKKKKLELEQETRRQSNVIIGKSAIDHRETVGRLDDDRIVCAILYYQIMQSCRPTREKCIRVTNSITSNNIETMNGELELPRRRRKEDRKKNKKNKKIR